MTKGRKVAWLLIAATLIAVPVYTVAMDGEQRIFDVSPLHLTPPLKTFDSTFDRGTRVTISVAGNIVEYKSPNVSGAQYEHIGVGTFSEGYVLCYKNPFTGVIVRAYDVGYTESGFGLPTTSLGPPVTVTRNTADNLLQLKQEFFFDGVRKSLMIKMQVKNLSDYKTVENIILRRQVDFDVDTGGASGWASFDNYHARTSKDGVFAWNDPKNAPLGKEAHGMCLRHLVKGRGTYVAKVTDAILDTTCNPGSKTTPVVTRTDDGHTLQYNIGALGPGISTPVWIQYERF